eukprot:7408831-Pyramimonas_sp.AAC.1
MSRPAPWSRIDYRAARFDDIEFICECRCCRPNISFMLAMDMMGPWTSVWGNVRKAGTETTASQGGSRPRRGAPLHGGVALGLGL